MAAYKASAGQVKAIWALGRKLGMDRDDLHAIAYRISGVESISTLTAWQAGRMIDELRMRAGETVRTGDGRATAAQQRMIAMLVRQMGWADQPERLRGYIRRMCGADDVRFLTPQQASCVIDGLKAMRDGGRAERRREVSG
ncbi:MAG: DUF1018 domain-containing protein [Clostridia bacterium]|nr:DUF1018 domain-containing protein [Clostridia bacterium]